MSIEFQCHQCGRRLRTRDEAAGRQAKCPECGSAVQIPGGGVAERPVERPAERSAGRAADRPPPGPQTDCPVCGERISATAPACPFCGEVFEGQPGEYGPPTPTPIRSGDVLADGWEIYKANLWPCVGAVLIVNVLNWLANLPGQFLQALMERGGGGDATPVLAVLMILVALLTLAFQLFLQVGQAIFLLRVARGEPAEIGDIFTGGPFLLRMIGNSIIFGLMLVGGFLLLIVPGILVALMFWPFVYVLVDQDPPGLESLWRSKEYTRGNWGAAFVLWLVGILLTLLGVLMCLVGTIFTVPLAMLYFPIAYLKMSGQPTALDRYHS